MSLNQQGLLWPIYNNCRPNLLAYLPSWVSDKGRNYSIATVRVSAVDLVSQAPTSTVWCEEGPVVPEQKGQCVTRVGCQLFQKSWIFLKVHYAYLSFAMEGKSIFITLNINKPPLYYRGDTITLSEAICYTITLEKVGWSTGSWPVPQDIRNMSESRELFLNDTW